MVGACGGVGSTVALGLTALKKRLAPSTGLVTELPDFRHLDLVKPDQITVGGHEIRSESLLSAVRTMHSESRVFSPELIAKCAPALRATQRNIKPGIVHGSTRQILDLGDRKSVRAVATAAAAVDVIRRDLTGFRERHALDHVVVVNVASSEPPLKPHRSHNDYPQLAKAIKGKPRIVPASTLYALGSFAADCSYINFTPSAGARLPAVEQFARERDVLYAGRDGKTGETLLKSVLAPMFAMRHLNIQSWIGHNVLGNRDGEILSNPDVKASKIKSKDGLVSHIVGYSPDTRTSIEYVPSLKDWKIAWDFIHFSGFLDTTMSLQFIWSGSDSILAAPLIIDLVRLTEHEYASGRRGPMNHLGCFFKDPRRVTSHQYADQWRELVEHLRPTNPKIAP